MQTIKVKTTFSRVKYDNERDMVSVWLFVMLSLFKIAFRLIFWNQKRLSFTKREPKTFYGADNGSRTRLLSLGSWCSTDELYPHNNNYISFFYNSQFGLCDKKGEIGLSDAPFLCVIYEKRQYQNTGCLYFRQRRKQDSDLLKAWCLWI